MRRALILLAGLCIVFCSDLGAARTKPKSKTKPSDEFIFKGELMPPDPPAVKPHSGLFGVAQVETIWLGADASGAQVVEGGVWDFDNRGTLTCPAGDVPEVYIKNGAFSQGWTSEDVYAQKDLYWHAEDFTHPDLACSPGPIQGAYSAWCGILTPDPTACFKDPPGYGTSWSQWLCRSVPMASAANTLQYTFRSHTEPGYDYVYVIIDGEFPDSCGWVGELADTIRCYDGINGVQTEMINLSNLTSDPSLCDDVTTANYDGDTVKICFVVITDTAWDDEDGNYPTCDGAMTVDSISVTAHVDGGDTTLYEDFEGAAVPEYSPGGGWGKCGGWSAGDYAAIRDVSSFVNRVQCGFTNSDMSGCVLSFFDPSIPGEYGTGGHQAVQAKNIAWSPPIYVGSYPPRDYVLSYDRYYYNQPGNWTLRTVCVSYLQNPDCPTGGWSTACDNTILWYDWSGCRTSHWDFSGWAPADAESIKVSLGYRNFCASYGVECNNGNESPIFDNVRVGIIDMSAPEIRRIQELNYTDAFPESDTLSADAWAMVDAARDLGRERGFVRLSDTLVVPVVGEDVKAELCFRVVPGPGTDLGDQFFTSWFPGDYAPCETSAVHCARMDTAFLAGNGQTVEANRYASVFHEEDPRYPIVGGEGVEIFPDSLFTPGSKIFYYIRASFLPGPGPYATAPFGADPNDVSTLYEASILPDMCKDPLACLLYVDCWGREDARILIEDALGRLGRTWDTYSVARDYYSYYFVGSNGIGNRLLGPGKYRLDRAGAPTADKLIIGPSLEHLAQYSMMLVNTGIYHGGRIYLGDGGICTPNHPTNDVGLLDDWINEGAARGLWISGDNVASNLAACSPPSPAIGFLRSELATDVVSYSYRELVGHDIFENCRVLKTRDGEMRIVNEYSSIDSLRFVGSGCPWRWDYDVLQERDGETGHEFVSVMYDESDYYASVDHVFTASGTPSDSVRTKLDGFSLHKLRKLSPPCDNTDNVIIALYMRDVLGGYDAVSHPGYFRDRLTGTQYCPPLYPEDLIDVPPGRRTNVYTLFQNYPNPFHGGSGTTIHYTVARAGVVELRIFDVAGRLVNTIVEKAELGDNYVVWHGKASDGRSVASGVYFYQIKAGDFKSHKKMLLIR